MKKLILVLAVISLKVSAQTGEVNYTRTVSFDDIEVEGLPAEFAAMMPKEDKANYVLYFNPQAAVYEAIPQDEKESKEMSGEGFMIKIETHQDEEKYYTDITSNKAVQQKELAGRTFLINEPPTSIKWKMTGNQKKILDRVAMEATSITDGDTIEAWYTPEVTVPLGPQGLAGLPGLILEATINKKLTIVATAINLNKDVTAKIVEPKKGKKVTHEEFEKLVKQKQEERMQEMETTRGGGQQIMIMR